MHRQIQSKLVVNVVVLGDTIYMDYDHVNMLGGYAFILPDLVARGGLRPLRDPAFHDDEG